MSKSLIKIISDINDFKYFCARTITASKTLDIDALQSKVNNLQRSIRNCDSEKFITLRTALNNINYAIANHRLKSNSYDMQISIIRDDINTISKYSDSINLD